MFDWTKTMHNYTIFGLSSVFVISIFFTAIIALLAKSWWLAGLPLVIILYNIFAQKFLKLDIKYTPSFFKTKLIGSTRLPSRTNKEYLHQDPLE